MAVEQPPQGPAACFGSALGTHFRTHCSTLFLCSFQKHNIADMVQTGTDLPLPPEPSVKDIAFKACCSRIFVVMPGMILRRPWRDPVGSGQRPERATRS